MKKFTSIFKLHLIEIIILGQIALAFVLLLMVVGCLIRPKYEYTSCLANGNTYIDSEGKELCR